MNFKDLLVDKIDNKTKPKGSLGLLETIAFQIATIQNTLHPKLNNPHIIVFAADHGLVKAGVSAYPEAVTAQMVRNFLNGGAAINVFCKQHNIKLQIVDAGVNADFEASNNLIIAKTEKGTHNALVTAAMTQESLSYALNSGAAIVQSVYESGCNVIGFGEMGIGNTSAASLITAQLLNIPLEQCVGRGTGLNDDQLAHKITILTKVLEKYNGAIHEPTDVLKCFGGFEIAQICGAIQMAKDLGMLILVDGFIVTSALLVAFQLDNTILENCIFCHQSQEAGHKLILEFLKARPLMQLDLRLGEGTGCAIAYPIIQSAVAFLNEMANFEEAKVSR